MRYRRSSRRTVWSAPLRTATLRPCRRAWTSARCADRPRADRENLSENHGKAGAPGSLRDPARPAAGGRGRRLGRGSDPRRSRFAARAAGLLATGAPPDVESDGLPTPAGLSPQALGNVWRAYLNSEPGIARFFLDAGRQASAGELPAPPPARLGLEAVRPRAAGGLAGSPGTGTGEAGIGSSARLRPSAPATDPEATPRRSCRKPNRREYSRRFWELSRTSWSTVRNTWIAVVSSSGPPRPPSRPGRPSRRRPYPSRPITIINAFPPGGLTTS